MKYKPAVLFFGLVMLCVAQRKDFEQPAMRAARGTRGAVACGSEYAAEAGMRIYFHGGNAVDAGVATMFADSDPHQGWQGLRHRGSWHHAEACYRGSIPAAAAEAGRDIDA